MSYPDFEENEFLQYMDRPLGPKSSLDIEDLLKTYKFVNQNHSIPSDHYAAHPKVKHFAPARTTSQYNKEKGYYQRFGNELEDLKGDWANCNATVLSERDAILEASRCLKCVDAPCISACPSSVDIPAFIQAIENQNFYTAGRIILNSNSNGASCGSICATSDLCSGSCTLATPHSKGINIEGLQLFALNKLKQMQIQPTIDPKDQVNDNVKNTKIAIVGAGPAGLSVATFLARFGYNNITIFDKEKFAGGINSFELPEFRLPHSDIEFEVSLLTTMGVKFVYGRSFVEKLNDINTEISYEQLRGDGYTQIFLGFGRPSPIVLDMFKPFNPTKGVYNSKEFLPLTTIGSKPLLTKLYPEIGPLPDFTNKRVIVLGGGDVAVDAATTSLRLGSKNVSIVFRKNTTDMRCMLEERRHAEHECIDFIPYCAPKAVISDENGNVKAVEFYKQSKNNDGNYVTDEDEFIRLKADIVITAFGCKAIGVDKLVPQLTLQRDGCVKVDEFGRTNIAGLYAGGDLIGASTTVGASNDGKIAAWAIHCAINQMDINAPIQLPNFHTPIDDVSLEVVVDGIKYPNPFVLASAPPCTSKEMIARAFDLGWGGAVVKTFVLSENMITNVGGRISVANQGADDYNNSKRSWFNIELITEKSAEYWYNAMSELKRDYPSNVVISSVMCRFIKDEWTEMVTKSIVIGKCDAIELNLSCPHMDSSKMATELGQCPESIEVVVGWCVEAARSVGGENVPIYAKLTPNITDITTLATAVERGLNLTPTRHPGGVTAINTVSGVLGFKFDASANRHGVLNTETNVISSGPGGYCGAGVRPLSFKAVVNIHKTTPRTTILATGGIDSAQVAYQMMLAGAPIFQVCSAVMNRDYTIVQDFIYGLKALLYIKYKENSDYKNWAFQNPPHEQDQNNHRVIKYGQLMRDEAKNKPKSNPVWKINTNVEDDFTLKTALPQLAEGFMTTTTNSTSSCPKQSSCNKADGCCGGKSCGGDVSKCTKTTTQDDIVPGISSHLGKGVTAFVPHPSLSRFHQTVALINDDNCIRCGRCYATCNDNGYQAISMDPITRKVVVDEDKCTSCGICESACPYPQTISFIPRTSAGNESGDERIKVLATYRGSDVRAKILEQYPMGLLSAEVIAKAQADAADAKKAQKSNGCASEQCCGGSCKAPPA